MGEATGRDRSWAVTGPAGAGKSRFCELLAARGAAVIDADREGHRVLELPDVKRELTAAFGRASAGIGLRRPRQ